MRRWNAARSALECGEVSPLFLPNVDCFNWWNGLTFLKVDLVRLDRKFDVEAQALIEQLMDSRDDADIMAAARELAPRKGLAPQAARLLVDLLNNGTAARAAAAAFVLGEWGATALGMSPSLLNSLRKQTAHENVTVRHWCVAALRQLGHRANTAVPELIVCLRDPDDGVRSVAAHALAELGRAAQPAVGVLVDMVHDPNDEVRQATVAALVRIDPHGERFIAAIRPGLRSASARIRAQSAEALGRLRSAALDATGELNLALNDGNATVRLRAMEALARILPAERPLLNAIGLAIHDADEDVRAEAVDALRLFAHEPQAIAPQLLSSMRDGSPRVRFRAIELLEKFVADMGPMIPAIRVAIANAFHDSSELVQTRAVKASGTIAQWTERADPRLVNALFDADGDTRLAAVLALAATHHDPEAIDALRFRLGDERADVRVAACHALIACGEDAGAVLATLIHELGDSDTAVQLEAMRAIKLLGASATSALEDVREKTADSNPEVRAAAMRLVSALELA
ncbi:MAG: HEAT repeat domain-containing protein [Candidatus Hydrogenedentes bacterium]|nr:HEAT repeat domain-containing protein [Candidatus Hydrogenedentota bacterium]